MSIFALIDCNNFYCSCERVFNPALENMPVVVLSNNDGCIISRTKEAKKLGIPMGAPFFKWQQFCIENNVQVFSSNYELYGDMSARVMKILAAFNADLEIYSIDEAFLNLTNDKNKNLLQLMQSLRNQIKQYTGIPVSIGIGETKTLAKAANYFAKLNDVPVFALSQDIDILLKQLPLEKIWGIGYNLAAKFKRLGIANAKELKEADQKYIRLHSSVSAEKTLLELRGLNCIDLSKKNSNKQIISSRSFGKPTKNLDELQEAISHYAVLASKKLRKSECVCSGIYVFLQTNIFSADKKRHQDCVFYPFPIPTADTREIIRIAKKSMKCLYKPGYKYHKAGLVLINITPKLNIQQDIFASKNDKSNHLMEIVDCINTKIGKNKIFYAAEGIKRNWEMKCDKLSLRYTTHWEELVRVCCE